MTLDVKERARATDAGHGAAAAPCPGATRAARRSPLRRRLAAVLGLPLELWQMLVTYLPGPVGSFLRYRFWRRRLKACGRGVKIEVGVHIQSPQHVSLGDHCWIDRFVLVLAGAPAPGRVTRVKNNPRFRYVAGEVVIGARTHLAPYVIVNGIGGVQIGDCCGVASGAVINSYSHHYRNAADKQDPRQYAFSPLVGPAQQAMVQAPVVLEDWCAVCLHAVLLPGTTLERGSWVASGAVVSGAFASQVLVREERKVETKSLADLVIEA